MGLKIYRSNHDTKE